MTRVLLTGFGPFPGTPDNASAWLVTSLAASGRAGTEVHAEILPTEWTAVSHHAPRLLDTVAPDVALHFGVSPRANAFRIERFAHNATMTRIDAAGAVPQSPGIVAVGAERLSTAVDAGELSRHLTARGLRATPSGCAGRYLCNYLYYLSLHWAAQQPAPCMVAFVHIPPRPVHGGPFREDDLIRGGEEILSYMIAAANANSKIAASVEP